jgi:peroxiredoxin
MFKENSITDTVVLAITVDSKEDLQKVSDRVYGNDSKSNIELLSDPGHKVINSYGLLNPESRGLPHPATYIIDKKGIVRWKFVEVNYRIRPDSEQVLKALKSIMQ